MPDSNPKLTTQLHSARDALLTERTAIIRRAQELQAELDMNSTQIEAADTLMFRFNPEHVSLDIRSEIEASPMLVVGRPMMTLANTVADAAVEQVHVSAEKERQAVSKPKAKPAAKKAVSQKKLTVEEQIAAVDAALGAKSERSPERQAIASYFQETGRNETILKILESKDEPVNAARVARDYKALYPLSEDNATLRNLHASRVSAALYYLKARGQAIRIADDRDDGKPAENVRWELSASYRGELRKTKSSGRIRSKGRVAANTEQPGDDVRLAASAQ